VIIRSENFLLQALPGPNIKTMSAADEKMINDAIELANQFAYTSLNVSRVLIVFYTTLFCAI